MLGQTPAFCKVCKYATRIKDDPLQQLNKALHCIELDETLSKYHHLYNKVDLYVAEFLIDQFTEDDKLRSCLKSMHKMDYANATWIMESMILREEGKL